MTFNAQQQGDVWLYHILDDGDIVIENGVVEMNGGLGTAAYLSLFGGNEDDNGRPKNSFTWWGNFIELDSSKHYVSELQHLMQTLPLITGNLRRIEDAALRDLKWFLTEQIASSVQVEASIPDVNRVDITVRIEANGQENTFQFTENWKLDFSLQLPPETLDVVSEDIFYILSESGDFILQEDGDLIEQESRS